MNRRRMLLSSGGISLPEGYTAIEYLESDGSHYIDTGFVPNQDTRVKMSILASGLSGETYAYGARNSAGSNAFLCALEPSAITFGYAIQYRAYEGVIDGRYDIDQNKNIMTVNGTELSGNYVESFSSESNLTLFGRNTAGSVEKLSAIKIYSCQIYDNGTLVRNFIPAMNASGEAGLYDLKNDVWYALKLAYGCYIQDTTGKLWTASAWNGSATPNGVAVYDESCQFIIALEGDKQLKINSRNSNPSMTNYNTSEKAIADFNGAGNTEILLSKYGSVTSESAGYCASYTFPNGQKGYLGSAGEWNTAFKYKDEIDAIMALLSGDALTVSYWTSTYYGRNGSYYSFWYLMWTDANNGSAQAGDMNYDRVTSNTDFTRPFGELTIEEGVIQKMNNKAQIRFVTTGDYETPDGNFVAIGNTLLSFDYPVESDIEVAYTSTISLYPSGTVTIFKGNKSLPIISNNINYAQNFNITSITPTEDDKYIYTF